MSSDRLLVYTCITGGYDRLEAPGFDAEGVDFVCLSDTDIDVPAPWVTRRLPEMGVGARDLSRYAKMHPHLLFPHHQSSVYVDGNIAVVSDPRPLVADALRSHDLALYEHPLRDCAYEEARECARIGHDWSFNLWRQMRRYRRQGFPARAGLLEGGIIIRNHRSESVRQLMEAWWRAFKGGVRRDQLSLPFLAWQMGVQIGNLGPSDARFAHRFFELRADHCRALPPQTLRRGKINRLLARVGGRDRATNSSPA